jgi:phytoene dehydrogenase-like protein
MHFARVAGENLVSPDEKATGIGMYVFLGFLEKYGFGVAVGGSGSLTNALIACIEAHGGQVVANAEVREVLAAGGRATGVVLEDGTRHMAKDAVIGAIHPHLLPDLVPSLPAEVARGALRTQITDAACITVHAALDAPLKFKAPDVDAVMVELMPDSYETLRRAFDDLRYGGFVRTPLVGLGSLSQFDPTRVPEGKAILHAWDYVPYHRPDGASWDDTKRDYAKA